MTSKTLIVDADTVTTRMDRQGEETMSKTKRMSKTDIELAALSGYGPYGSALAGSDVARVSRDKRCITMRHAWRDDIDARVWAGVRNAAWGLARQVADETGRGVEIYASGGWSLDVVEPTHRA